MSTTVNIATSTLLKKRRDGQADSTGTGAQGVWASTSGAGFSEASDHNPTGAWDFTQAPTVGGVAVSLAGHTHDDRYFTEAETTSAISTAIANLVDSSPATLDTLNELATALGDDPNFATTVATAIGLKAPIASPTFTTQITTPLIYGSSIANGNIIIEATSHATRTTAYLLMQQAGGAVCIGAASPTNNRMLTIGTNASFSGVYNAGSFEMPLNKSVYIGSTDDTGQRVRIMTDTGTGHVYWDYYQDLHFRSGLYGSGDKIIFKSTGEVQLLGGGLHVGGASDAGDNNLIVDGTTKAESLESLVTAYVSGFAGAGYKVDKSGSDYNLTIDNLTVRKMMKIYELQINKLSSVNGGMIISIANAKCTTVSGTIIYFDEGIGLAIPFVVDDYIKAQQFNGTGVAAYLGKVTAVNAGNVVATTISGAPWNGMDLVQLGNSNTGTYSARQNLIYMTAADTNNPYIEGHAGITAGVMTDATRKFRLGNLTGITDAILSPSGYGLYAQNVFLSGKIVASAGAIANWNITTSALSTGAFYTNGTMYFGTSGLSFSDKFKVTPAGALTAKGIAELGTDPASDGTYYQNIAMVGNEIRENSRADDFGALSINLTGYLGTTSNYRMTTIGNGKGAAIATFRNGLIDLAQPVIIENTLDVYGPVDLTVSSSVNLGGCHNIAVGSTNITCSASEVDMTGMTLNVVPKGNKLFIMFSAPFYITAANQTLNLYISIDGDEQRHTTTYIGSGFQNVSFQHIASVTADTSYTVKIRWLGSTSIQQRGSTDAERVLTVIDLM